LVGFFALGDQFGLTRPTAGHFVLDEIQINFQTGRTAVHHYPDGRAMGFSKRMYAENRTERIASHIE
jgi:hypothetical protein